MASVPKIQLPQSKLDKLEDDLKKLEVPVDGGSVPAFQRHGYLQKMGHTRLKWFKRFFVLRDSFLLSYNLQKSDYTVEPRSAIHMGCATIQLLEHAGEQFCFLITTSQRDRFLFAAESASERDDWVRDLELSRSITHGNMIKLAVENKCLAEDKGAVGVATQDEARALSIFSNEEYIQNTPITGGAEGWLRTTGFNPDDPSQQKGLKGKKPQTNKLYFVLRDSHILMFNGGDMLTKPRGVMYLLGTVIDLNDNNDKDGEYHFKVRSPQFGDEIDLVSTTKKIRKRWMDALRIAARVTHNDFTILNKEHAVFAKLTLTPRAAPAAQPNQPTQEPEQPIFSPMAIDDYDVQGEQLDPGTQQAYDMEGNPLLRNPDGKLVTTEGEEVAPVTPRFGAAGDQLDPFNRALPAGAVPMFLADGTPIGVGPDGEHYLPGGNVVDKDAPHFDAAGNQIGQEQVTAADAVAPNVAVALKVRTKLKGEDSAPEAVDALGRTFRAMAGQTEGTILNADGDEVPLGSARRIQTESGQLVEYDQQAAEEQAAAEREEVLSVKVMDNEGNERTLGSVHVDGRMTLKDVRVNISKEIVKDFPEFVFLFNGIPLLKYEENEKLAVGALPEIYIRGNELKAVSKEHTNFTAKVKKIAQYEEEKRKEQNEFDDILAKVRQGKFLKSTRNNLLD